MKNSNGTIGNRTSELPACSAVPQPTAPPRAPTVWYVLSHYTGCPTCYRTRHFFNNFTTNEDIATKFEADLPHGVRNVKEKNVLLFKFRCNIFIGVRIINP